MIFTMRKCQEILNDLACLIDRFRVFGEDPMVQVHITLNDQVVYEV